MFNVQLVSSYERGFDRRKRETSKSNMSMTYIRTFVDSASANHKTTQHTNLDRSTIKDNPFYTHLNTNIKQTATDESTSLTV